MTIIVFLLDTSASMNQRVFLGGRPTLLDVAKSAVETFVKVRQRSIDSRQDRYMLLTFEEPPLNIKAGWKENLGTFMSELKNLQANGLTTLGNALRHTFDVLNVNRMQHGIDTYGQGRCPFYLEPSIIVAITDGGKLSSNSGVQEELKMHGSSPGFELTREPFRWDQRLFSLVLRMSGQPAGDRETGLVPSDLSPIDAMCEVTGGRSYCITSHRMLHQCIDSLVQKVQAGVVIHFEKVGLDPPPLINNVEGGIKSDDTDIDMIEEKNSDLAKQSWHNSRKMIYVPRSNQKGFAGGFWPIPESFWPDTTLTSLPPRSAHPHVKFTCVAQEPLVIENFPFDKYELEPSPLTQYILARKQPSVCWQAYIGNGSKNSQLSQPFGYLKASTNLTCVNLFVMPHNYPTLLPLLDDLFRVYRVKPSNEWRAQFGMYVSSMPAYYASPLKRALIRMGAGAIAQSINEETFLSYSVLNYLKKLKAQAKVEFERTCTEVGARVKISESKRTQTSYKNPFDVPRHQLLDHIAKLRTSILRPKPTSDLQQELLHTVPVGQMGNYQEYLKRMPTPLREIESTPVRQHMFGNPFKIDKRMIIDEADIDFLGQAKSAKKEQQQLANAFGASNLSQSQNQNQMPSATNNNNNNNGSHNNNNNIQKVSKRKPGPLPRDYTFTPKIHRPDSPISLDISSPRSGPDTPSLSPASPVSSGQLSPLTSWTSSGLSSSSVATLVLPERSGLLSSITTTTSTVTTPSLPTPPPLPPRPPPSVSPPVSLPPPVLTTPPVSLPSLVLSSSPTPALPSPPPPILSSTSIPVLSPSPILSTTIPLMSSSSTTTTTTTLPSPVLSTASLPSPPVLPSSPQPPLPSTPAVLQIKEEVNSCDSSSPPPENVPVSNPTQDASSYKEKDPYDNPYGIMMFMVIDEEAIRRHNFQLRRDLYKEIRRPVFRTDYFFSQLKEVVGSTGIKIDFIKGLEREALRFKRKRVAEMLKRNISEITTSSSTAQL